MEQISRDDIPERRKRSTIKKSNPGVLIAVIVVSLIAGVAVGFLGGFFVGVASTKAGREFLEDMVQIEEMANVKSPKKLVREKFELQYPANWSVGVDEDDYDPDHMFSINSPSATWIQFGLDDLETDLEDNIQVYVTAFTKLMASPRITRFSRYGRHTGKGAQLNGNILGSKTTIKAFSYSEGGVTATIVQQYSDEDLKYVKSGLDLIERSFSIRKQDK